MESSKRIFSAVVCLPQLFVSQFPLLQLSLLLCLLSACSVHPSLEKNFSEAELSIPPLPAKFEKFITSLQEPIRPGRVLYKVNADSPLGKTSYWQGLNYATADFYRLDILSTGFSRVVGIVYFDSRAHRAESEFLVALPLEKKVLITSENNNSKTKQILSDTLGFWFSPSDLLTVLLAHPRTIAVANIRLDNDEKIIFMLPASKNGACMYGKADERIELLELFDCQSHELLLTVTYTWSSISGSSTSGTAAKAPANSNELSLVELPLSLLIRLENPEATISIHREKSQFFAPDSDSHLQRPSFPENIWSIRRFD